MILQSAVNDDFCDCPDDGSDEPSTSACDSGHFYCENAGYRSKTISSSRVGDGVCDCCDGSDEVGGIKCEDSCAELGLRYNAVQEKVRFLHLDGAKMRKQSSEVYEVELSRNREDIVMFESNMTSLKVEKTDLESQKKELSELETALEAQSTTCFSSIFDDDGQVSKCGSVSRLFEVIAELHKPDTPVSPQIVAVLSAYTQVLADARDWRSKSVQLDETRLEHARVNDTFNAKVLELSLAAKGKDDAEAFLTEDFDHGGLYLLTGVCANLTTSEYFYEICFHDESKQRKSPGSTATSLGKFQRLDRDDRGRVVGMLFVGGLKCWNGPERSSRVRLQCGNGNRILSVSEPEKCVYMIVVMTWGACYELEEGEILELDEDVDMDAHSEDDGRARMDEEEDEAYQMWASGSASEDDTLMGHLSDKDSTPEMYHEEL